MSQIYESAEDTFLMEKVLRKFLPRLLNQNSNLKFLEVGCGSGYNLQTAKKLGVKNIFSFDINIDAVDQAKKLGFNCVKSDLFSNIKGKFDLIIFNPPYLPEDKLEPKDSKIATTGGKQGSEIINEFLEQSKKHLNSEGKIFLLVSNLTKGVNWQDYRKKLVAKEKIFFEELKVYALSR